MKVARFTTWLGGARQEDHDLWTHRIAMGQLDKDQARLMEDYLSSEYRARRRKQFGDAAFLVSDEPVGEDERSRTSADQLGASNVPKGRFALGQQAYKRGETGDAVLYYAQGGLFILAETAYEGMGFGEIVAPLKSAVAARSLMAARALVVGEMTVMAAPALYQGGKSALKWRAANVKGDEELAWRYFDETYSTGVGMLGMLGGLLSWSHELFFGEAPKTGLAMHEGKGRPGGPAESTLVSEAYARELGLQADALNTMTPAEAINSIQQARRKKVADIHPDHVRNPSDLTAATERTQVLNHAYDMALKALRRRAAAASPAAAPQAASPAATRQQPLLLSGPAGAGPAPQPSGPTALASIEGAGPSGSRASAMAVVAALKGRMFREGVPHKDVAGITFELVPADTTANVFSYDPVRNVARIAIDAYGRTDYGRAFHEAQHHIDLMTKRFTLQEMLDAGAKADAVRAGGPDARRNFMAYRDSPPEVSAETARWEAEYHRLDQRLARLDGRIAARPSGAGTPSWMSRALANARSRLAGYAGQLAEVRGRSAPETARPLGAGEILVDANIAIAREKAETNKPTNARERASVAKLGDTPFRQTAQAFGETGYGGAENVVTISVERSDPAYLAMIDALNQKGMEVGRKKGGSDRIVVADAFFALTADGKPAALMTADTGIYNNMARLAGIVPEKLGRSVPQAYPDGFLVELNGRAVRVIPVDESFVPAPSRSRPQAFEDLKGRANPVASPQEFPGKSGAAAAYGKPLKALMTSSIPHATLGYGGEPRALTAPRPAATLADVPRADVTEVADVAFASEQHSGSSGLVRLAKLSDGRAVAVKALLLQDRPDGKPVPAETVAAMVLSEARSAEIYSALGVGPRFHGVWTDPQGRVNVVMDVARGDFERMPITDATFADLELIIGRMRRAGLNDVPDFQLYRSPEGRLSVIDPARAIEVQGKAPETPPDGPEGFATAQRLAQLKEAPVDVGQRYLDALRLSDPAAYAGLFKAMETIPKDWGRKRYSGARPPPSGALASWLPDFLGALFGGAQEPPPSAPAQQGRAKPEAGARKPLQSALEPNTASDRSSVLAALGLDVSDWEQTGRPKTSDPAKRNTEVWRVDQRNVKTGEERSLYEKRTDLEIASNELLARALLKKFPVFSGELQAPDALAYQDGYFGLFGDTRWVLMMEDAPGHPGHLPFQSSTPRQKAAMAAFAMLFGLGDVNKGNVLYGSGKPAMIDFEQFGSRVRPNTERILTTMIADEMPWVSRSHANRDLLPGAKDPYAEAVAEAHALVRAPGFDAEFKAMAEAAGKTRGEAERLLSVVKANAEVLPLAVEAERQFGAGLFVDGAKQAGLDARRTAALSQINWEAEAGDSSLLDAVRAVNASIRGGASHRGRVALEPSELAFFASQRPDGFLPADRPVLIEAVAGLKRFGRPTATEAAMNLAVERYGRLWRGPPPEVPAQRPRTPAR